MSDSTPPRRSKEPFGMIEKRVLAAPQTVLTQTAKIVYGVLNGEPNARLGKPVHLTQAQIAVLSGAAPRTVQDALKRLAVLGLITVIRLPALNGWTVNAYLVHEASDSALPPMPSLPKTHSPHMREVLRERQARASKQGGPAKRAESAHREDATPASTSAHMTAGRGAATADNEEGLQEGSVQRSQQEVGGEAPRGSLPVFYSDEEGLGFDCCDAWPGLKDFTTIQEALSALCVALRDAMQSQGWDVNECNALLEASWDESAAPLINLGRAIRLARACV